MIVLALLAIKIAVVYYFIKYLYYAKGCLSKIAFLFFMFTYIIINVFSSLPGKKYVHTPARQKACYSNIRVLTGAVEMYNMDHSIMMKELDFNTLIQEHYLKQGANIGPEIECEYLTEGSLSENGYIYCKKHGDLSGLKDEQNDNHKVEQKEKSSFIKILFSKLWSYEEKLDTFLLTCLRPLLNTTPGGILFIILALFGLTGESFNCGGVINSLLFLFILTHIKKEDVDGVVYEEVYSANEEEIDNEIGREKDNDNPNQEKTFD